MTKPRIKQMSMFDASMRQLQQEQKARMEDVELLEQLEKLKKEVLALKDKVKGTSRCSCTMLSSCGFHANIRNRLQETYNKLAYLTKDISQDM